MEQETSPGRPGTGTLYVVASPLGNLEDLSRRTERILRDVAVVAAEDTRRTRKLLSHLDAHPRLLSYHAYSGAGREDELLASLEAGESVAVVTDAGTPAVSDPGGPIVARAREAGITIVPIPGPSAVVTALSVSGLPADRFTFLGFPPRSGADRRHVLAAVEKSPWTVVVFEAPTRLGRFLGDLVAMGMGARQAAVARELTKIHEEIRAGTLEWLAGYYRDRTIRGEVTVVVAGAPAAVAEPLTAAEEEAITARARELVQEGSSRRDVAARLAKELNLSRNDAYRVVAAL
jgi:16S rRNA (cytidine1402-2'-O)-methyltransferase